jgi:hypothetical protein
MKTWLSCLCAALLLSGCATSGVRSSQPSAGPQDEAQTQSGDDEDETDYDREHGVGHIVLLYIPNRIFDVLDIVRARVRVGPGLALGARATELADVYLGAYGTVWAGLPGPRGEPEINWPVGLESKSGVEVSVADVTAEGGVNYGAAEVGLGAQILIVGFDVGVDVFEAADFVTGLLTIDLMDDDL